MNIDSEVLAGVFIRSLSDAKLHALLRDVRAANIYGRCPFCGKENVLVNAIGEEVPCDDLVWEGEQERHDDLCPVTLIERHLSLLASQRDQTANRGGMAPREYQEQALRTVYPDLTFEERLGLCGLGLAGEMGEAIDMLKKHLYNRTGKPLDVAKLQEELGDVLWYFSVLLSTLGLTFEEVMAANIAKLERRHPNGFTPRYTSDRHDVE
ncbi:MAG: nucleoside triphosphate pyrophosphohydrolase family protein [Ktedonobacteraceae bacterium]|nr:nucleoside triphosphate pyrophosphohydrolase family protein [Ktedonobacteraceae bacterium]